MRNTAILFIVFSVLFASCSNRDKKAEKLIQKDLFESLYDYSSYEPVKTEEVDSAFSSPQNDSTIYSLAITFKHALEKSDEMESVVKDNLSAMKIWSTSYSNYSRSKFMDAKREAETPPPPVALPRTVRVLIADRLLPSRACFLLTP